MPFLNIFSKKQEKEKPKPKILIDHREKNSLVPSLLANQDCEIEFTHLPIADYIINNTAIERKTISDLKSSIANKRIFSQLEEIKQYPSHLLILEGFAEQDPYNVPGIHENAMRGFILSLALNYQTPFIFTLNEKDTATYLSVLAKKQEKTSFSLRPSKILLSEQEQKQFILEGFPHIGPVKAKALLEKFSSLQNIFSADEQELQPLLGKQAKDFRDIINHTN